MKNFLFSSLKKEQVSTKRDNKGKFIKFGEDDRYPSLVELLYSISCTAKLCADINAKATYGGAFGNKGAVIVGSKGQTLNETLRTLAREYAKHNNAYLHIRYNALLKIRYIDVVPSPNVRIGITDDKDFAAHYIVYNNYDEQRGAARPEDGVKVFYFDPSPEVLTEQIKSVGGLEQYTGQLLHIKKTLLEDYSLSDLHTVLSEAQVEHNSQEFRLNGSENGFLNSKLITVTPFDTDDDRERFKGELNKARGSSNSGAILMLESSGNPDIAGKELEAVDLTSPYNDKLFEYSDKMATANICKAHSVPQLLVSSEGESLFGASGALYAQAQQIVWERRSEERQQLQEAIVTVMRRFYKRVSVPEIINPHNKVVNE